MLRLLKVSQNYGEGIVLVFPSFSVGVAPRTGASEKKAR